MKILKAIVLRCVLDRKLYACIRVLEDNVCYCLKCNEKKDCEILAGEVDIIDIGGICPSCRENRKPEISEWWKKSARKK